MKKVAYEFIIEAQQPISHTESVMGNEAIIARKKVRKDRGGWAMVPVVSGNAMRNRLRSSAVYALLDAAGLLSASLSEPALRLLFNGGGLSGRGDSGNVKLDEYNRIVDLIPPLALLGGCVGNQIMEGRLHVSDLDVLCEETKRFASDWANDWLDGTILGSARECVEEVQRVRMDPSSDPGKRLLLTEAEQVRVNGRLMAREAASEADDALARAESKSTLMPYKFERIAQGTLFSWSVTATCYSPLDEDTFATMVAVFLSNAKVGGRSGSGHGQLKPVIGKEMTIKRASDTTDIDMKSLATGRVGDIFRAHVSSRKEQIEELLSKVVA